MNKLNLFVYILHILYFYFISQMLCHWRVPYNKNVYNFFFFGKNMALCVHCKKTKSTTVISETNGSRYLCFSFVAGGSGFLIEGTN